LRAHGLAVDLPGTAREAERLEGYADRLEVIVGRQGEHGVGFIVKAAMCAGCLGAVRSHVDDSVGKAELWFRVALAESHEQIATGRETTGGRGVRRIAGGRQEACGGLQPRKERRPDRTVQLA
jgi:hypothetical protein